MTALSAWQADGSRNRNVWKCKWVCEAVYGNYLVSSRTCRECKDCVGPACDQNTWLLLGVKQTYSRVLQRSYWIFCWAVSWYCSALPSSSWEVYQSMKPTLQITHSLLRNGLWRNEFCPVTWQSRKIDSFLRLVHATVYLWTEMNIRLTRYWEGACIYCWVQYLAGNTDLMKDIFAGIWSRSSYRLDLVWTSIIMNLDRALLMILHVTMLHHRGNIFHVLCTMLSSQLHNKCGGNWHSNLH